MSPGHSVIVCGQNVWATDVCECLALHWPRTMRRRASRAAPQASSAA